jgi:23S rRNA (uracil1939-C5)-methyltransferase
MAMTDPIISIAARGEGRTASGKFVPLAAPGDWLDESNILQHGPHHQAPPCRHFGSCGGCQLQHVDDAAYADWMVERIGGALTGQGLPVPAIRAPHLSPPHSRRRASLKAQRVGKTVLLGFNEGGSHRLIDVRECPVLAPSLWALIGPLRVLLGLLMSPRGAGSVQMTLADQGVDLMLTGVSAETLAAHEAIGDFARLHGLARLSIDQGDGPETQWEPEPATVSLGGLPVGLPHGAFLQATADGEAALVAAVREAVRNIADLFAGLGTFTLGLRGERSITAVEGARAAALALLMAANRAQRGVKVEHRDLYRRPLTMDELAAYDAVILDPPRAGAEEQAKALASSRVPRIAYVSCNPASLAKDARILADGGYVIDWVQPVGQFRWSTHMELAASISRLD